MNRFKPNSQSAMCVSLSLVIFKIEAKCKGLMLLLSWLFSYRFVVFVFFHFSDGTFGSPPIQILHAGCVFLVHLIRLSSIDQLKYHKI